jgi:protein SCO1/2
MADLSRRSRRDLLARLAGAARASQSAAPAAARSAAAASGDNPFPNVELITQDGVRVRFYDDLIKDKVVLINFMFTTCADVCPRATENLSKVASGLGDRLEREVRMISVTVDPKRDTPQVLKQYAQKHRTGPGWYFVTGRARDIDAVRESLGVNRDGGDKVDHTGVLVYGNDRTGQWAMTPSVETPRAILWSLNGLLSR